MLLQLLVCTSSCCWPLVLARVLTETGKVQLHAKPKHMRCRGPKALAAVIV